MADECGAGRYYHDVGWIIPHAITILTMQGGFALVEAGSVRHISIINIMMKNLSDFCMGALVWWLVGWSFAFGPEDAGGFIGYGQFIGIGVKDVANWFFQLSFATTTATIDSGAVAERMKFVSYLALSAWMSAWTYPVVAHWVWSANGFLYKWQYVDFAGSSVVHLVGGCSALVSAIWVGPRLNRFTPPNVSANERGYFQPYDHAQLLFGTFVLWIGWYAFNSGSTLAISGGSDIIAGHITMTTTVGGAVGGVLGLVYSRVRTGKYTADNLSTGILAGLVSITAGCHVLEGWEAGVVGGIGALIATKSVELMSRLRVDDPASAISIHGVCGLWGTLAVGLFAHKAECGADAAFPGVFYAGAVAIGRQAAGVAVILAWSIGNTLIFFLLYNKLLRLPVRASDSDQLAGEDFVEHAVDQGERMMQYMRSFHEHMSQLEAEERTEIRSIILAFLMLDSTEGIKSAGNDRRSIMQLGRELIRRVSNASMQPEAAEGAASLHKSPSVDRSLPLGLRRKTPTASDMYRIPEVRSPQPPQQPQPQPQPQQPEFFLPGAASDE